LINKQLFLFLEYTRFDKTYLKDDPTIEENSKTFDPNNNQLATYLWTSLGIGPQCRIKYTIMKDICTGNKGAVGAKCIPSLENKKYENFFFLV
jgi:hypothetical protein